VVKVGSVTFIGAVEVQYTNQPSTLEYYNNQTHGVTVDLSGATEMRLSAYVNSIGAAGAALRARVIAPGGSTFDSLAAVDTDVTLGANAAQTTGWVSIRLTARDVNKVVSLWCLNGNGVADPKITMARLEWR